MMLMKEIISTNPNYVETNKIENADFVWVSVREED